MPRPQPFLTCITPKLAPKSFGLSPCCFLFSTCLLGFFQANFFLIFGFILFLYILQQLNQFSGFSCSPLTIYSKFSALIALRGREKGRERERERSCWWHAWIGPKWVMNDFRNIPQWKNMWKMSLSSCKLNCMISMMKMAENAKVHKLARIMQSVTHSNIIFHLIFN